MENSKIDSLKNLISEMDSNFSKIREAMKAGNEEDFKQIKSDTIKMSDEISGLFGSQNK